MRTKTQLMVLPAPIRMKLRAWTEKTCLEQAETLDRQIMESGDLRLMAQWFMWKSSHFEAPIRGGSLADEQERDTAESVLARIAANRRQEVKEGSVVATPSTEIVAPEAASDYPVASPPPDSRPAPIENTANLMPKGRDPYPDSCSPDCKASKLEEHANGTIIHGPRVPTIVRGR